MPDAFTETAVRLPILIAGWTTLALVVAVVVGIVLASTGDAWSSRASVGEFLVIFGGICGAIAVVVWFVMLIPFDGKYHHVYRVEGTVTSVSNVLSEASGDLTRQPVITLDSMTYPLVVDDPRAVTLDGRDVTLRCEVDWNYQAADSYVCRIISYGEAPAR